MAIRNIEVGFPDGTKTYASLENCRAAIEKIPLEGMCNVRIVPIVKDEAGLGYKKVYAVRYTAYFYAFENLQDAVRVSRAGFCVHN